MESKYAALKTSRIRISIILLLITQACHYTNTNEDNEVQLRFHSPTVIPLNTGEELKRYLAENNVQPIINISGDTVKTGIKIPVQAKILIGDSIKAKKFTPVTRIIPAYSNVHKVPDHLQEKDVDNSKLQRFGIRNNSIPVVLLNSRGDTIPTGIPVPVTGLVVPCMQPKPVPALKPRMRENAIYDIQYLDTEEGMNNSIVSAIAEDKNGNLWFSTQGGGVSRYDGESFAHYTSREGLLLDNVTSMLRDKNGHLWFGTYGNGICCYDGNSFNYFTEAQELSNNTINCMLETQNGDIWFGTHGGGACRYQRPDEAEQGTFTHYAEKEGLPAFVYSMFEDSRGRLWFGSALRGVSMYEPPHQGKAGMFVRYTVSDGLPDNQVNAICEDSHDNLWFGTREGVSKFDGTAFTIYTTKEGLPGNQIKTLFKDKSGKLWIGTTGGGACYFDGTSFTVFTENEGLSNNRILSIHEDKKSNLWFGTDGGGVCRFDINSFVHYSANEGLSQYRITAIHEDKHGDIWFGTSGEGIIKYDPAQKSGNGQLTYYTGIEDFSDSQVFCIEEDNLGNLWFGIWGFGVWKFDGEIFTKYSGFRDVKYILADHDGDLWFGSHANGIICYRISESQGGSQFIQYTVKEGLPQNRISCIHEDQNNNLWISSPDNGGVTLFESSNNGLDGTFTNYSTREGLSSNYITSITEDRFGNLWFESVNGINCFELPKDTFPGQIIQFSEMNGLADANIKSIIADTRDNIWASTGKGLNLIRRGVDIKSGSYVTSFLKPEGLKGMRFEFRSAYLDRQNRIWWGNEKGVEMLDLNTFQLSDVIPAPQLQMVDINGEFLDYRNLPDSVRKHIFYTRVSPFNNYPLNLELPYKKNHLTFHYSAVDLSAQQKVRYSYVMEGLNDTWSLLTEETKAEYRNLPSGNFTFKVKAIGESHIWSEPFEYKFSIRPPWWLSWLAFAMYSVVGVAIIYRIYRFQLNRKLDAAEKKRLIELDLVKNRLYSNITHEFRTPLTLIHGPVSQALTSKTALDQKDIQSIFKQSERLQQLINQILELQKLEAGKLKPDYEYGEILQVVRYLFSSFEPWAREKNISLIFSSMLQEVFMDFDQEKITQIISNLMSNAIRHTPRKGKVSMTMNTSTSGDSLIIQIQDTGTGISDEDLPYIFDRFYQSKRSSQGGTGIGLALVKNLTDLLGGKLSVQSKLHEGSTFTVSLPITRTAHKAIHTGLPLKIIPLGAKDDEAEFIPQASFPGKPILLIIEDHPEILRYVESCLVSDYTVLTAMNGNEGIQIAYEHIPDLIISDVMMPGMDGFELTEKLKKDILTSHIPIILLTGRGDHDAKIAGIEYGADAFVTKPFDPPELILRVKKLLELRANLMQYYFKQAITGQPEINVQASARENEFIKKLRTVIEEHMNDSQFNMDMLSKHMAMSHPQLHRKITALTGESTGKFVRSLRLSKAIELLKNSDLTVSEIAYETGFSEPGYFTKVFSKAYNLSPTEYRAKIS